MAAPRGKSTTGPRLIKVPKGQKIRAATRRMQVRTRPQVKAVRVKGQTKTSSLKG